MPDKYDNIECPQCHEKKATKIIKGMGFKYVSCNSCNSMSFDQETFFDVQDWILRQIEDWFPEPKEEEKSC